MGGLLFIKLQNLAKQTFAKLSYLKMLKKIQKQLMVLAPLYSMQLPGKVNWEYTN